MSDNAQKNPVKASRYVASKSWHPLDALRREFGQFVDEIAPGTWLPRRYSFSMSQWPKDLHFATHDLVVDIAEKPTGYEITAELPGLDEKNIDLKIANGSLTIKGEKEGRREEKDKDYVLQERHYGSVERSFRIPDGVDSSKIEAIFKNGVLTITLPKSPEAKNAEKKIRVKAA